MNVRAATSLVVVLILASTAGAVDDSADQRLLAGLRQRGLYRLAETYCADRLKRADLSDRQRAELVIELSRCLAERAVGLPPEVRPPLWKRALKATEGDRYWNNYVWAVCVAILGFGVNCLAYDGMFWFPPSFAFWSVLGMFLPLADQVRSRT